LDQPRASITMAVFLHCQTRQPDPTSHERSPKENAMNARDTIVNRKSLALKSFFAAALAACCFATAAPAGEELQHGYANRRPMERTEASFGAAPSGETRPEGNTDSYNPDFVDQHERPDIFGETIKINGYERHQYEVEIAAGLNLFALETMGELPLMIAIYDVKGGLIAAEPMSGGIACGLMIEAPAAMTVVIEIYNPSKLPNGYVLWMNG
jgi:hypothetical protein